MWKASFTLVLSAVVLVSAGQSPELIPQGRGYPLSYRVAFGGDGRWLAQGNRGGVRLFSTTTGRLARELTLPDGAVESWGTLAFAAHPHRDLVVFAR